MVPLIGQALSKRPGASRHWAYPSLYPRRYTPKISRSRMAPHPQPARSSRSWHPSVNKRTFYDKYSTCTEHGAYTQTRGSGPCVRKQHRSPCSLPGARVLAVKSRVHTCTVRTRYMYGTVQMRCFFYTTRFEGRALDFFHIMVLLVRKRKCTESPPPEISLEGQETAPSPIGRHNWEPCAWPAVVPSHATPP